MEIGVKYVSPQGQREGGKRMPDASGADPVERRTVERAPQYDRGESGRRAEEDDAGPDGTQELEVSDDGEN